MSYAHYAAIENGNRSASIEDALNISEALQINQRIMCHAWAKDQMPDGDAKSYFEPNGETIEEAYTLYYDLDFKNFLFVTTKHLPFLEKHPITISILRYLTSNKNYSLATEKDLLDQFRLDSNELTKILEWLVKIKAVSCNGIDIHPLVDHVFVPQSLSFKRLQTSKFSHISSQLSQIEQTSIIEDRNNLFHLERCMTDEQAILARRKLSSTIEEITEMTKLGGKFYSLVAGLGVLK